MDKKKVYAFIVSDLGTGGQERQLTYLIAEFKKNGGQCVLIVWNADDISRYKEEMLKNCLDVIIYQNKASTWSKIMQSRKFLSKYSPYTLHCFTFFLNFLCWLITLGTKTHPIGGIRSRVTGHLSKAGILKGGLSIMFPRHKISNNHTFAVGLHSAIHKYFLKDTFVVNNHLDVTAFESFPDVVTPPVKTASIGRIYSEKRLDLTVDVIHQLKLKGYPVRHYHLGRGVLLPEIQQKILDLNLRDNFIFAGESSDISGFLRDKSIFIHTADVEGYPNVIMEAMVCGKPIVTTNCGDVSYLLDDSVNGFIVPIGATDQVVDKVIFLLQNDALRLSMGQKNRAKAEAKFHLSNLFDSTISIYKKICAA